MSYLTWLNAPNSILAGARSYTPRGNIDPLLDLKRVLLLKGMEGEMKARENESKGKGRRGIIHNCCCPRAPMHIQLSLPMHRGTVKQN